MAGAYEEPKWGGTAFGSAGGVVTWSFASMAGDFYQWDASITNPTYQALIVQAFALWSSVADIQFQQVADSSSSDIRLGWDAIDGAYGTVGETMYSYYGAAFDEAEIRFDTGEQWSTSPTSSVAQGTNFFAVAVHEIGHALGLAHLNDPSSIMYPYVGATTLSSVDVSDIQALYGVSHQTAAILGTFPIVGGPSADFLQGTSGNDIINGYAGNDTINAGAGDDRITGGPGNDTIDGGPGNDTAVFSGARASYALTLRNDGAITMVGPDGTDTVRNVEHLVFDDRDYNLQILDKAGTISAAALNSIIDLYIAYFDRVPEASGLGYWIDQYAGGKSLDTIAAEFYQAGIQFSSVTGYSADMTEDAFVRLLYANVLDRTGDTTPTQTEVNYWINQLDTHAIDRDHLAQQFLHDARQFYGDPDVGFVPLLLDEKDAFGKLHAVTYGVDYHSDNAAITNGMALAAAVTPDSYDQAVALMGLGPTAHV